MVEVKEEKLGVWERLQDLDRRFIYVLVLVVIFAPLLSPLNLPLGVSPETSSIYNLIEELPPGSLIALSFDYSAASRPEMYPQSRTIFAHALRAGHKVILFGMWSYGATILTLECVNDVIAYAEEKGYTEIATATYGEDYVNLGLITASGTGVMQMAEVGFYPALFPEDNFGTPLADIPFYKGAKHITDFMATDVNLLVSFASGTPGIASYTTYWWATYRIDCAVGAVGVSAAGYYPDIAAGILVGMLTSTRGAMEYDQLTGMPGASGLTFSSMDAQSMQHLLVILFIVIGNIGDILVRRRRTVEEAS